MNFKIRGEQFAKGKIYAPASKSYAHRLIISAFLSNGKTVIKRVGNSEDVISTVNCLKAFGGKIKHINGTVTVYGNGVKGLNKIAIADCGESGSTLRFLMPLSSALGIETNFICHGRLGNRPNDELIKVLSEHGVTCENNVVKGKLTSGVFKIDASVSSQYITGLLLSLPLLNGDSEIILDNEIVSKNYIDITLEVLDVFKIKYKKTECGFIVYGNQQYLSPKKLICEGDWSGSAFPLALGVLVGDVTVKGLNVNSKQGDAKIVEILRQMGGNINVNDKGGIRALKSQIKPISINLQNQPDIVPILSVVAAVSENGVSEFSGIERLKIKESDRIQAIIDMLKSAGIKAEYIGGVLNIRGGKVKGGAFNGYADHRIVMSSAVLALLADPKEISTITDMSCANKSYPEFYNHLQKLGVKINV